MGNLAKDWESFSENDSSAGSLRAGQRVERKARVGIKESHRRNEKSPEACQPRLVRLGGWWLGRQSNNPYSYCVGRDGCEEDRWDTCFRQFETLNCSQRRLEGNGQLRVVAGLNPV